MSDVRVSSSSSIGDALILIFLIAWCSGGGEGARAKFCEWQGKKLVVTGDGCGADYRCEAKP